LNAYAFVNFVVALLLSIGLLAAGKTMGGGELAVLVLLMLWALLNVGGIFEHRRWAFSSELLRLPVTAAVLAVALPANSWHGPLQAGLALSAAGLALWLFRHRGELEGGLAAERVMEAAASGIIADES
jgi:hypothetical protein